MTAFAQGHRARTLPLPRHRHIKPIEEFDATELERLAGSDPHWLFDDLAPRRRSADA